MYYYTTAAEIISVMM